MRIKLAQTKYLTKIIRLNKISEQHLNLTKMGSFFFYNRGQKRKYNKNNRRSNETHQKFIQEHEVYIKMKVGGSEMDFA